MNDLLREDDRAGLLGRLAQDIHQVMDRAVVPAQPPAASPPATSPDPTYDVPSAAQLQQGPMERLLGRFRRR